MGELHINDVLDAYTKLTNRPLELKALYTYLSTSNSVDPMHVRISFEQFCALVAEFNTDGCDRIVPLPSMNGIYSDRLYWTSALLKTCHVFRFYLVRPIINAIGE